MSVVQEKVVLLGLELNSRSRPFVFERLLYFFKFLKYGNKLLFMVSSNRNTYSFFLLMFDIHTCP